MTATNALPATSGSHPLAPYDAVLLVSFGGPEKPDEVIDFLEVVTRGAGIPRDRLAQVGEHYFLFGGRSPINDQNKALISALQQELSTRGVDCPIYWGNRNWHPFIDEALRELVADGRRRVLMLTTSAYPSYSGCRTYREAVAAAASTVGAEHVRIDRAGNYALDEGFVEANRAAVAQALAELPGARLVFVTHSIPTDMDDSSGPQEARGAYSRWHEEVAERIAQAVGAPEHDLVFCSRSGRPGQPWLEPDVDDHLAELHGRGVDRVVLAPIGFISDHMEVIYDLDTQARQTCDELGIQMVRSATAGTSQTFVAGLADRLLARAAHARQGDALPAPDGCGGRGCCPNLRNAETPAID
ncbi:ferrochelatase [Luteococcus sp. OSA5]|uniref:ferrochelatase n=1 Tax=Luteococcus sp. OSA5 TaxID=3401630 RepID=UPI003B4354C1